MARRDASKSVITELFKDINECLHDFPGHPPTGKGRYGLAE